MISVGLVAEDNMPSRTRLLALLASHARFAVPHGIERRTRERPKTTGRTSGQLP
jgi:hypothetical protein